MKGGKLKQFLSQGLAKQGNWSCESDGRRLGLAGLTNCARNHRRGKMRSQGMLGCVVHVHHQSWEGFGVMVTWAQALQSCYVAVTFFYHAPWYGLPPYHHNISWFFHQALASFTAQSRCYSSASFSLFTVMALHPIYCSLFKPCSKDRIINFLMGCSSWALIITVLHK